MDEDLAPDAPELLSVPAAAARLAISEQSTWRYVRAGRLPAYKVGGSVRLRSTDVDRFAVPYEARA